MKLLILTHRFPLKDLEEFHVAEARYLRRFLGSHLAYYPIHQGPEEIPELDFIAFQDGHKAVSKFFYAVRYFPWRAVLTSLQLVLRSGSKRIDYSTLQQIVRDGLFVGSRVGSLLRLPTQDVYYSYWGGNLGLAAVLVARRLGRTSVVRYHGSDFYEWGSASGFTPLLHSETFKPDLQLYLSESARTYATLHYGKTQYAISPLPLEIPKVCDQSLAKKAQVTIPIEMISISRSGTVKRLSEIYLLFKHLQRRGLAYRWSHFGCSIEELGKAGLFEPGSEEYIEASAFLPNDVMLRELEKRESGVFVNLSASEGTPISMLEASLVGLPIVATRVGNVGDYLGHGGGLLIDSELDRDTAFDEVCQWLVRNDSSVNTAGLRDFIASRHRPEIAGAHLLDSISRAATDTRKV